MVNPQRNAPLLRPDDQQPTDRSQEITMTDTTTTTYSVPEISCGHCKATIEGALQGLGDVTRAEVDIDAKTVTVEGGDRDAILTAIEDAGYDVAQ